MIIKSQPFPGPYVRIRGRIHDGNQVEWDKALRSFRKPRMFGWVVGNEPKYFVRLMTKNNVILEQAPVWPEPDNDSSASWVFTQRMNYHSNATRIALIAVDAEIGNYAIPPHAPSFTLVSPTEVAEIRARQVMAIKWQQLTPFMTREPETVYHARFSPDAGMHWYRFSVNLYKDEVPIDLAIMPQGRVCCVQILGTNGYHTSYIETPYFQN
jgi:hypothetical protein